MSYLSLYRKWRPQSFDEIVGQSHVTQTLKHAIDKGRLSHAYLFCGPRGTGKTSIARILAKAINCVNGPTSTPCNVCESCLSVNDGSSMDVLELDAASNRRVEEIRELLEKIPYSSTQGHKKVYIIDEVHMLTTESFNTLLKTLEEPPGHVVFVLATTEPHKVLPTILSRCQRFDFRRISVPDIESRLREVATEEGIGIDDSAISLIATHAQGALRDALGVLEQLASYSKEKITSREVVALLGITDSELLLTFTDILLGADLAKGFLFTEELIEKGFDIRQFIQDLLGHLRNLFLLKTVPGIALGAVPDELKERFTKQAKDAPSQSLMFFINTLSDVYNQSRWATDIRLLFEIAMFKMTRSGDDASLEGILHRIERLESALSQGIAPARAPAKSIEIENTAALKPSDEATAPARPAPKKATKAAEIPAEVTTKTAVVSVEPHDSVPADIAVIEKAWPQVLKLIKDKKRSRYDFFARTAPGRIADGKLVLIVKESDKAFIESSDNLRLLQSTLKVASGVNIPITCEVAKEAAKTVAVSDKDASAETLVPADDYIKLVQDMFGAKIVEEIPIEDIGTDQVNNTQSQED